MNIDATKSQMSKEAIKEKIDKIKKEEELLASLLEDGIKKEKELSDKLENIKRIVQEKMELSKKTTQKEVKKVLKSHKKKIETLTQLIHDTKNIIDQAFLDASIQVNDIKDMADVANKARMGILKSSISEKQTTELINELNKEIKKLLKEYPQLTKNVEPKEKKPGIMETYKNKRAIYWKKKELKNIIKDMGTIINRNLSIVPQEQMAHVLDSISQANDIILKQGVSKEEIDNARGKLEADFNHLNEFYPLKKKTSPQEKEAEKIKESKKNKLKTLIGTAGEISKEGFSISSFSQGGRLMNLKYEAERILQDENVSLETINEISQALETESQQVADLLEIGKISEKGLLIRKEKVKETAVEQGEDINEGEILEMKKKFEDLKKLHEIIKKGNEQMAKELGEIKEERETLENSIK